MASAHALSVSCAILRNRSANGHAASTDLAGGPAGTELPDDWRTPGQHDDSAAKPHFRAEDANLRRPIAGPRQ